MGCPFTTKTRDAVDGRSFFFMLGVRRGWEAEVAIDWAVAGRVVAVTGRCCVCRRRDGRLAEAGISKELLVCIVPSLKGIPAGDVGRISRPKLKSKRCSPWTGCNCGVFSSYSCHPDGLVSPERETNIVDGFRRENNPIWIQSAPKRGNNAGGEKRGGSWTEDEGVTSRGENVGNSKTGECLVYKQFRFQAENIDTWDEPFPFQSLKIRSLGPSSDRRQLKKQVILLHSRNSGIPDVVLCTDPLSSWERLFFGKG